MVKIVECKPEGVAQIRPPTSREFERVRRLAYEASDCGLLSADLAAGIRRVKGVKKLGVRLGNWLTAEQAHALCRHQTPSAWRANVIGRCLPSYWPVDSVAMSSPS